MVKFKCLAHFPVNHLADPVVSRLILLCANLRHSLIMGLIVSSLSPHSLHLLFCWILSIPALICLVLMALPCVIFLVLFILALIWLVLKALYCAAIRKDSVSLLKFPFLRDVQVLSCEMFISRLSILLSVLFLMAVISPRSYFSMLSSSRCIDVSTLSSRLASPLPRSFPDTYSLSTSSLGCNGLCMVINLLVLWSICLSSSLVHLRKGPEYLTRGSAQVFILL